RIQRYVFADAVVEDAKAATEHSLRWTSRSGRRCSGSGGSRCWRGCGFGGSRRGSRRSFLVSKNRRPRKPDTWREVVITVDVVLVLVTKPGREREVGPHFPFVLEIERSVSLIQ